MAVPTLLVVSLTSAGCSDDDEEIACPALHVLQGGVLPGAGTEHRWVDLTSDQVWTAKGSPHRVLEEIPITDGRTLTIEACAVVELQPGAGLEVGDTGLASGDLVAVGQADQPILFTGAQKRPGAWIGLRFLSTTTKSKLAHVTIEYAGDNANTATLFAASDNEIFAPMVALDHVTLRDGLGDGLVLEGLGELAAGSDALTITGMSGNPVRCGAIAARSIPQGTYTGNGDDRIHMVGEGARAPAEAGDVTWPNRGVPYIYDLGTYQTWMVTLTLEPGLEVFVKNDPAQDPVDNGIIGFCGGAIVADGGDAAGTITFRGEGDRHWAGLRFLSDGGTCEQAAGSSRLSHVKLLHAGTQPSCENDWMCPGLTTCSAAILLEGDYLQMDNTEIVGISSDQYGVAREYCGDGDEGFAAAALANTFVGPMHCPQSDQNECDPPGGACDEDTSCCLHDLTCHGTVQ